MTPHAALQEAKKRAGSEANLARMLGINRQSVHKWRVVPADKCAEVSHITGIAKRTLRPDVFTPHDPKDATNGQAQGRRAAK